MQKPGVMHFCFGVNSLCVKARESRSRSDAVKTVAMVKDAKFHLECSATGLRQKPVILAIVGGVKPAEGGLEGDLSPLF